MSKLILMFKNLLKNKFEIYFYKGKIKRRVGKNYYDKLTHLKKIKIFPNALECQNTHCKDHYQSYVDYFKKYANSHETLLSKKFTALIIHAIALNDYVSYDDYLKRLKANKNFFYRSIKKAIKKDFHVNEFQGIEYLDDRNEIYQSMKIRSFGPVIKSLLSSKGRFQTDDLDGSSGTSSSCKFHWERYIGVFSVAAPTTTALCDKEKKLVAFARLHRIGNVVTYKECIGHGLYLTDGVMKLLHAEVMKRLLTPNDPFVFGVQYLVHGSIQRGGDGFYYWKKSSLFNPFYIEKIYD